MKQIFFNKLLMLMLLAWGGVAYESAGTAWADEYTIGWGTATGTEGTYTNFTANSGKVDGIFSFLTSKYNSSDPAYNSSSSELRLYYASNGKGGSITLLPVTGVTITGFEMTTTTTPSVKYYVDGGSATSVTASSSKYTVSNIAASTSVEIQNANTTNTQLRIKTIKITYTTDNPTCAIPTFSPEAGAVASGTEVSISSTTGATIYYTTDGTTPSESSNVYSSPIVITEATTIKAYAVKDGYTASDVATAEYTIKEVVSGYNINFENDLDDYVDWVFDNIGTSNTAITAHGGSKYGANINSSGNAVTTASITTKEKVANPISFTCYVSKTSTNTTASTWYVQVSSDGETWTDVATQDAKNMNQGVWTEFTADLSSYSNVYVRLYYKGTNAVRTVDDISIIDSQMTGEISIDDATVAFGSPYTIDEEDVHTNGELTVVVSNPNVASVSGTTITPLAVGTTTVTVTSAETYSYTAATCDFTLTVTAPEGKTTSATALANVFEKVTSTSDLTSGEYLIVYEEGSVAFDGGLETLDAVSNTISVTIDNGEIEATEANLAATFTIDVTAGTIKSKSGQYIGQESDANGLKAGETAYTNTISIDDEGNATVVASGGAYLRYNAASGQNRFRYFKSNTYTGQKAIQLYKRKEVPAATISYTIPSSGLGTFCSEYPLDLSQLPEGVNAYIVVSKTENSAMLEPIAGAIKGGVGIIVEGTGGTTVEFNSVDSENVPEGNMLEGTLAPTYLAVHTAYGMSGGKFYLNNEGVIPANRAYLPVTEEGNPVKVLVPQFDDATGIEMVDGQSMVNGQSIYNLAGQRLTGLQKGINIVNGKKVLY